MMLKHVLFLGPPGVGKGTYAKRVAPRLRFAHISPGDMLRQVSASNLEVRSCLEQGQLVSESVVFELMETEIRRSANLFDGLILDGFPRNSEQARGWIERKGSRIPDLVVVFNLPYELLVQKLLGRRVCSSCGDLYNIFSFNKGEYIMPAMLPKRTGLCDKCGCGLVQRSDDKVDIIRQRLEAHQGEENKLVQYMGNESSEILRFEVKTGISQLDELVSDIKTSLGIL